MKVIKGGLYLLISIILLGGSYLAFLAGTQIKVFNPLAQDSIVSGLHLSSFTRDDLLNTSFDPAEINIDINTVDGNDEIIKAGNLLANPLEDEAFQNVIKTKAFSLNNNILPSTYLGYKINNDGALKFNRDGLISSTENLDSVTSDKIIPSRNAYGVYNAKTNSFDIVPEVLGTQVNTTVLVQILQDKLNKAESSSDVIVSLKNDNIYVSPKVTVGSAQLAQNIKKLNDTLDNTIYLDSGWDSTEITSDTFASWLSVDEAGNITINQASALNYLESISKKHAYYTSKEEALKEKRMLEGYLINYQDEINKMTVALDNNLDSTSELTPFKVSIDDLAVSYTADNQTRLNQLLTELGPEFVYVNIAQQFMWYYKNATLVVATPVTTGTKNNHDTHKGLYSLDYKAMNVTLTGNNDDGSKYESKVVYWMPFNGGEGIHDADNWRSTYGGDIYTYNGSHGCVNTPREKVAIIYNNISKNCPVLVE